ncbi:MAG: VOC family protein [Planctomycetota bacterium]
MHHVEIYVGDLERSIAFWTPFMRHLGYEPDRWSGGMNYVKEGAAYFCFLPAPLAEAGYHRQRIGLNHLAFRVPTRAQVDAVTDWVRSAGHTVLYEDRHPFAGGEHYYALFCEDPDRIKVEVVAEGE